MTFLSSVQKCDSEKLQHVGTATSLLLPELVILGEAEKLLFSVSCLLGEAARWGAGLMQPGRALLEEGPVPAVL